MNEDERIKWMLDVHKKHAFGSMTPKWLGVTCDQIIIDYCNSNNRNIWNPADKQARYVKSKVQKFYNNLIKEMADL